jgi:phenylalanyl-tRNA synthetase alpha chain
MDSTTSLHPIERSLLRALLRDGKMSIENLSKAAGLSTDQVRRGTEWLKFKKLIYSEDRIVTTISLGISGYTAAKQGLPERRLVSAVKEGCTTLESVLRRGYVKENEINAAISSAKRNRWISFSNTPTGQKSIFLSSPSDDLSLEEKLLNKLLVHENVNSSKLSTEDKQAIELLKRRPGYIVQKERKDSEVVLTQDSRMLLQQVLDHHGSTQERNITTELITSGAWRNVAIDTIDVIAAAPLLHAGRQHPLVNTINEIREIIVGLGFTEIDGPFTQTSFWNFDVLFIPQDHPAREMQDTFYIHGLREDNFADSDQIGKISSVHKKGWGHDWNIEEAKKVVLRTHTTPVTLRYIAENKPRDARLFSIGRVFRNEKVSYKHLVEFNQLEGVVTGKDVTLRDLMGLVKEFYSKLGLRRIKFWPTFFPYTEPSLQCMIYNEELGKWIEMGGMGMMRPEVTHPLDIENPVLAWGLGIERIAMLQLGLHDARILYQNNLNWLRRVPKCQL